MTVCMAYLQGSRGIRETRKCTAYIVRRPTAEDTDGVPFLLFANPDISIFQASDQVVCRMTIELGRAQTDRFDNMRVTAGGLCDVQSVCEDAGVVVA